MGRCDSHPMSAVVGIEGTLERRACVGAGKEMAEGSVGRMAGMITR